MNTDESTAGSRSRFSYHGDDDPGEGGVSVARPKGNGLRTATSASTPGVPGPDEPLLDISELARTVGMRYRHVFDFPPGRIPELTTVGPTRGEIRMTNTGAALILRGEVKSTVQLECSRCLNPIDEVLDADIEEDFDLVATHDAYRQEEVQAVDEDTPAAVIEGNVLNVADLLRQSLLLAAPLQPLCREDCPGIDHESYLGLEPEFPEASEEPVAETPLKHLAELLEARRKASGGEGE